MNNNSVSGTLIANVFNVTLSMRLHGFGMYSYEEGNDYCTFLATTLDILTQHGATKLSLASSNIRFLKF